MANYQYVYRNTKTNELVDEYDSTDYVLDVLGITIKPKGEHGEHTLEQQEFISNTVDWFFSGNWVKDVLKDDVEEDRNLIIADMIYEENLSRRLLEE